MDVETTMQVGCPKFRFPTSENACPLSFFNLVHCTTSQGPRGMSAPESTVPGDRWLVREDFREWIWARNGDDGRKLTGDAEESLDWKRRSKGRWEGLGLR